MEIKLKPVPFNLYPLGGLIIKGDNPAIWAKEIQALQLQKKDFKAFPIPYLTPNSVWGCLLIINNLSHQVLINKHEYCQVVHEKLFIPEFCKLMPAISNQETEQLFFSSKNLFHPEVGLVELQNEINWLKLLSEPEIKPMVIQCPPEPVYIPKRIRSFQVFTIPPEDVLKNFEANHFPEHKNLNDDKLSLKEKFKFQFYKLLFKNVKDPKNAENLIGKPRGILNKMNSFLGNDNKYLERLKKEYEALDKRNQKQFEKLMDLFKKDPLEALKYAIPLNENHTERGGSNFGDMGFAMLRHNFSLFDKIGYGDGGGINLGDNFYHLKAQYVTTAIELFKKGEYQKAAFIYMRLLKDYPSAANVLEQGGFYKEAASIYLKHVNDKEKAANCFEKGHYYYQAIELYKELSKYEKVGDLFILINKEKDANIYFESAIDIYKTQYQFVKASLIYKKKMHNPQKSQNMLLEGWRTNKDSFNCLNNYFHNLENTNQLMNEIQQLYATEVNVENRKSFLKVIEIEYGKNYEFKNEIRNIGYEIISKEIKDNPNIVSELIAFNEKDNELLKDTIRFKQKPKK